MAFQRICFYCFYPLLYYCTYFTNVFYLLQLGLIICRSCICEFAYSLKCTCVPKISTCSVFSASANMQWQNCQICTFLTEIKQGDTVRSFFIPYTINTCPSAAHLVLFFALLCFLLVIMLFLMVPKHSNEVLCSVPKHNKAVFYEENMC